MIKVNWCESCNQDHGPLYVCPDYSSEKQDEIKRLGEQFSKNLQDPKWIEKQLQNGVPTIAIAANKVFMGI